MKRAILIVIAIALLVVAVVLVRGCNDKKHDYQVRAVFDNGSFVVPGEDVRVAGANVGSVDSIDVSQPGEQVNVGKADNTDPGKAIIVMNITDEGFQDFRSDASCLIRPQSLIGEKFIDCTVTDPRVPGTKPPPKLTKIPDGEAGAGQYLLPLDNNGQTVDLDLINNIYRLPYAQRFRIILNELGAGLATRGPELNETITRANPTLMEVNKVLKIVSDQNQRLAQLAKDGDTNLTPLAEKRRQLVGFFKSAGYTAQASAERGADFRGDLRELPGTLVDLRKTFNALGTFSDATLPVFNALEPNAKQISAVTTKLGPFADATKTSLLSLGKATRTAGPDLVASRPIIKKLGSLASQTQEPATDLNFLLQSTRQADGFKNLMRLFYNTANTLNGYDQYGHYQRTNLLVSGCVEYVTKSFTGCETQWAYDQSAAQAAFAKSLPELSGGASPGDLFGTTGATGPTGTTGDTGVTGSTGDIGTTDPGTTTDGTTDPGTATDPTTDSVTGPGGATPRSLGRSKSNNGLQRQIGVLDYLLGQ